jgi:hypothetical protein
MTNRGKYQILGWSFRGETIPTNYYARLITSATAPTVDDDNVSGYTEIAAGNGYTAGGMSLSKNSTDWDVWTLDDTNDLGYIQLKDLVWTASGGSLPGSGNGARYCVLTDDNATDASREPYASWDLTSDRTVSSGQTLTLQDCELRIT